LSAGLNLTGTLNNGAVFILVDPQIALSCYAASAQTYLLHRSFNGNDAMGLFKMASLLM
jgi:hypothetical protein